MDPFVMSFNSFIYTLIQKMFPFYLQNSPKPLPSHFIIGGKTFPLHFFLLEAGINHSVPVQTCKVDDFKFQGQP